MGRTGAPEVNEEGKLTMKEFAGVSQSRPTQLASIGKMWRLSSWMFQKQSQVANRQKFRRDFRFPISFGKLSTSIYIETKFGEFWQIAD